MRIRAVLFDAAGTLIELKQPVGETYSDHASRAGVELPAWRLQDAFGRILANAPPRVFPAAPPERVADEERSWWRARVRETVRAADSSVRFEDFDAFFQALYIHYGGAAAWRLRPGVLRGLEGLVASGRRMAIASNFDTRLTKILEELGIKELFSSITLPAGCGAAKPSPAFFVAALADLGTQPGEALYLGDDPVNDVNAARDAGLAAASINLVKNLAELPAHVEALATLEAQPNPTHRIPRTHS